MSELEKIPSEFIQEAPLTQEENSIEADQQIETSASGSVEPTGVDQIIDKPATPPKVDVQNATTSTEGTTVEVSEAPMTPFEGQIVHTEDGDTMIIVPMIPQIVVEKNYEIAFKYKPFLGGYRDKRTGVEYHHAIAQTTTAWEIRDKNAPVKFHRDCQTKFWSDFETQCARNAATQMKDADQIYISKIKDQVIEAGHYVTADEKLQAFVDKLVVIQKLARKWLAKRRAEALKDERDDRKRMFEERARRVNEIEEKRKIRDLERRVHPKTKRDFELLYNGLEKWRVGEVDKIEALHLSQPKRLALLAEVLTKEAELIQRIEKLKEDANEENSKKMRLKLINELSRPRKWPIHSKKALQMEVDTPDTVRASKLRDLYTKLQTDVNEIDERLQVLIDVKQTVKEFDCNLTREMVNLVEREGDLISRGRSAESIEGLRQRITNLFFQFIINPEFNPAAKIHSMYKQKKIERIYFCRGCSKYLPVSDFNITSALDGLGRCKGCQNRQKISISREDDEWYSQLIRTLREEEAVVFQSTEEAIRQKMRFIEVCQEKDIRFIVESIWGDKSCISGTTGFRNLTLCRWDVKDDMTPWNCILVTHDEKLNHYRTNDPSSIYSEAFIRGVTQRHSVAKAHFSKLAKFTQLIR